MKKIICSIMLGTSILAFGFLALAHAIEDGDELPHVKQKGKKPIEPMIGHCYGGGNEGANIYSCYYDVDHDKKPDITLLYSWDGERLVLIDVLMPKEYSEIFGNQ
jgi:hypothetical protein